MSLNERALAAAAEFLAAWYPTQAREDFQKAAENGAHLTEDQIRSLKAATTTLADRARSMVEKHLAGPRYWWHLRSGEADPRVEPWGVRHHSAIPDAVDRRLRLAMGELVPVLEAHNAITRDSRISKWTDFSARKDIPRDAPFYKEPVTWPEPLQAAIAAYRDQMDAAATAGDEIAKLEREKAKKRATDIWDQT